MNLSIPVLICDENEEVRLLLKNMLSRHGYFHLLEAQNTDEVLQFLSETQFVLIQKNLLNDKLKKILLEQKRFLILSPAGDQETINLSAYFGVKHIISFPYSSKGLVSKINSLLSY
jgi:CheY-like chemotaxis protein